jgi:hypothetical protein
VQTKRKFRRYLLGYPERNDWHSLEMDWFTNADHLEDLSIAEEELIDDYIFGLLSPEDRARFEQHFLCTKERTEKVATSRALREYAQEKALEIPAAVRSRSWHSYIYERKWILVSAAACLCLLVVAVITKRQRSIPTIASNPAPVANKRSDQTALAPNAQVSDNKAASLNSRRNDSNQDISSMDSGLVFTLLPGLNRGIGGEARLRIPTAAHSATFTLLTSDTQEGRLKEELLSAEGVTVWSNEVSLTADQAKLGKVSLIIPAQFFHSDDYKIKLSQVDSSGDWGTVATYTFRVILAN